MSELSNVELNIKEMVTIILSNIGKMLHRRGMIKHDYLPEKVVESILSDKVYNFELDGHKLSINIMNFEIKHISANSPVDEYINKNGEYYKFIIGPGYVVGTGLQVVSIQSPIIPIFGIIDNMGTYTSVSSTSITTITLNSNAPGDFIEFNVVLINESGDYSYSFNAKSSQSNGFTFS